MDILPESLVRQLEFFETRALVGGPWMDHAGLGASQIGVTPTSVAELGTLTSAARAAYDAMIAAQEAARAAAQHWYDTQRAMRVKGSGLIKAIKAHSAVANNPGVYTLAVLPPPKTPTRPGTTTPAAPTNLTSTLLNDGSIELSWEAKSARGTSFEVWRMLPDVAGGGGVGVGEKGFVLVGVATGLRGAATRFVDETVPIGGGGGAGRVFYRVRAVRLGQASQDSPTSVVQFGVVGGGAGAGARAGTSAGLKAVA